MSFSQCTKRKTSINQVTTNLIISDLFSTTWITSVLRSTIVSILFVFIGNGEDVIVALQMPKTFDSVMLMYYVLDTGFLFQLCIVLVAAYSSTLYIRDKENNFILNLLLRIPCKYYLVARGLQCFISAFAGTGILCVVMILIWCVFLPVGSLKVLIYLTIETSIVVAFWCECGLTLSVFVPNRFVALTSPFVLQYIIGRICFSFLPENLNPTLYLCGNLLAFADDTSKLVVLMQGIALFGGATFFVLLIFLVKASKEIMAGKLYGWHNFRSWVIDLRTICVFLCVMIFLYENILGVATFANSYNLGFTPWLLPFMATTRIVDLVLWLALLLLLCDLGVEKRFDIYVQLRLPVWALRFGRLFAAFL